MKGVMRMIQYFMTSDDNSILTPDTFLQLLSISVVPASHRSEHPRVAHSHHNATEIYLGLHGTGEVILNGIPFLLQHGDILLIESGTIHDEVRSKNQNLDTIVLSFHGLNLPDFAPNHLVPKGISPLISYSPASKLPISIIQSILDAYKEGFENYMTICDHLLFALVSRLVQLLAINGTFTHGYSEETVAHIRKAKDYIDANYMNDITLEEIAAQVALSPSYLSHAFKRFYRFSPIQYLTRRRIGEAETLLIHTNKRVTEIAMDMGYETVSNFNNNFSKIIGMSPSQYRKTYRSSDNDLSMQNESRLSK